MEPYVEDDQTGLTEGATDLSASVNIINGDGDARATIACLLKTMGVAPREFSSISEFLEEYRPDQPGCLICDLRLPDQNDVDSYERLATVAETLPVIFTASPGVVPLAIRAIRTLAAEIVEKPIQPQALLEAVRRALAEDCERRIESNRWREVKSRIDSLTDKEQQVLEMILEGSPNKAIATRAEITERAVEMRRASVMRKLQAHSLAELIRIVTRHQVLAEFREKRRWR